MAAVVEPIGRLATAVGHPIMAQAAESMSWKLTRKENWEGTAVVEHSVVMEVVFLAMVAVAAAAPMTEEVGWFLEKAGQKGRARVRLSSEQRGRARVRLR